MASRIKVDPGQLEAQAQAVRVQLGQMKTSFGSLKREMTRSSSFWTGKAGDAHRKRYTDRISAVEEMLKNYESEIRDLEIIAGVYREKEQKAVLLADELPPSNL